MPNPKSTSWFEYPIRVQPHHTDYSGVVWHGTYITWMESARVECLRSLGISFEKLVGMGYDLPVVGLDIRYRQPLTLGMDAIVKTRLEPQKGIRLNWCYEIETVGERPELCITGKVTLVTVDMRDGGASHPGNRKVVRRLPDELKSAIAQVEQHFSAHPTKPQ